MSKLGEFVKSTKFRVGTGVMMGSAGATALAVVPAHAEATANTQLTSAAQTAVDQTIANINGILPIALTVLGVVMGIMIGIRVFRKITKSSAAG